MIKLEIYVGFIPSLTFESTQELKEVCQNYRAGMDSSVNVGAGSIVPASQ